MKVIDLRQSSPEWHQFRSQHFNASDAAAMLGVSKYKTRDELIQQVAFGTQKGVSAFQEQLFAQGHDTEAKARLIAEELIGDDLSPVIIEHDGGLLSASLDGLTLDGSTIYEHKLLNAELRGIVPTVVAGEIKGAPMELGLMYEVQMEQQLLCCNEAKRVLFCASNAAEFRACWYYSNPQLRKRIIDGWAQFAKDVAAARAAGPVVAPVKVEAAATASLPAVSVRLDGSLAVVSNLGLFSESLKAFVERMPKQPTTDQEFADTEAACKALKKAEDALKAAEDGALASMSDVEAMRRAIADCSAVARAARLAAEKMVSSRKEAIKLAEVSRVRDAFNANLQAAAVELGLSNANVLGGMITGVDFNSAIKNLRTLASVRDALNTKLADLMIQTNAAASHMRKNMARIDGAKLAILFPDSEVLATRDADAVAAVVDQRVRTHNESLERAAIAAAQQAVERERAAQAAAAALPPAVAAAPPVVTTQSVASVASRAAPDPEVELIHTAIESLEGVKRAMLLLFNASSTKRNRVFAIEATKHISALIENANQLLTKEEA